MWELLEDMCENPCIRYYADNVEMFKYAIDNLNFKVSRDTIVSLSYSGHIDCLKMVYEERVTRGRVTRVKEILTLCGRLDELKWLITESHFGNTWILTVGLFYYAALGCHRHIIEWFLKPDICSEFDHVVPDEEIYHGAIESGNLDMIKWAYEKYRHDESGISIALLHGHVNILDWLIEKDMEISSSYELYKAAIKGNSLDSVKWLVKHFGQINKETIDFARKFKNVEIINYLVISYNNS
jgi:hypothetical protein